ncbi:MAG: pyrroline-5-carboxylate reductase [Planctomycetaceae bacterium]
MNLETAKIGFIGTGRMATALATGFLRHLISADRIRGCDPVPAARQQFQNTVGSECQVFAQASECLAGTDVVFLSVKPQTMAEVLQEIKSVLTADQLIVSIAAGLTIAQLESWLPEGSRLVRVMPNTPCLVGSGASGISRGSAATQDDMALVTELLSTVGIVETVPEKLLDAVTGLSGSGPAYVFQMIEAASDGGVKAGLPRDIATRLAAQTLLGSAQMVLTTGQHPAALKDAVTSPGGTTIAGLHQMELGGVRAALISAVEAATRRSLELGSK